MVNPNYMKINAAEQMRREDSVFHYYQKLIRLRHEQKIIVYGDYKLLFPESREIYAYLRRLDQEILLVACNFTDHETEMSITGILPEGEPECLIANYEDPHFGENLKLRPYEAAVWKVKKR